MIVWLNCAKSFFIQPETIVRELEERRDYIKNLVQKTSLPESSPEKDYPHLNWSR